MSSVALILGAGPRIGAAVSAQFAASGYKVAVASRNGTGAVNDEGYLSLKADFSKPESISSVFEAVTSQLGAPSVVIYNAAALTPPPDQTSALSIPADRFTSDLNVNTVSPYVAAQEAVKGWDTLPKDVKKSFIYTGNMLNVAVAPAPMMLNLGVGKSASAYWIGVADATYKAKGYRFFYADERTEEGQSKGQALDGPAHGDFYTKLAKQEEVIPWHATFSKGKGYVKFN